MHHMISSSGLSDQPKRVHAKVMRAREPDDGRSARRNYIEVVTSLDGVYVDNAQDVGQSLEKECYFKLL